MPRRLISSGSSFEREFGYSRAVVDGDWVFVSGTTGFDYARMTISEDPVEQTEQCMRNIEAALAEAGATLEDTVRVRIFVDRIETFDAVKRSVIGRKFAAIRPANTTLVTGFIDPRMKIEIEVTAKRRKE
jgi:enamine deaminase RidA (YjgF/YER057c/UK114 family)